MRKGGGEEVRSVRCMCDVCAAHGDRAAVGVDVDAQGSSLREDESHFPLLRLKKGGVAKAKGEGEKKNECTTECKSRRRRDEKAP